MTALFHMISGAPDPVAPFSHAVESDGWVFVTGQMPFAITADDTSIDGAYPEGIEAQTHQVMRNLEVVLRGLGLGLEHVLSVRVYLRHFDEDYGPMNAVYAGYFEPGKRPARTCIGVTGLARGARVEIDLVARRPMVANRTAADRADSG
jgi:reactive intermediate/imine deaminase